LVKITNQTVDYMALGFMSFMPGLDITWAIGRVGLKVSPVLGPKQARLSNHCPRNVNAPHKTHKAPRHIINSVINSYFTFGYLLAPSSMLAMFSRCFSNRV